MYNIFHFNSFHISIFSIEDARQRCLTKGYTPDQFEKCLHDYEDLDIWHTNRQKTKLIFVNASKWKVLCLCHLPGFLDFSVICGIIFFNIEDFWKHL